MAKEKKNKFAGSSLENFMEEEKVMSLEEAKAFRASLYKPQPKPLNESQKREAFRVFWASNKKKYGKAKTLEQALWLHLKSIDMTSPEQFSEGLANFGLKKVK